MAKRRRLNVPAAPIDWNIRVVPAKEPERRLSPAPIASVTGEASAAAALQEVSSAMSTARAEGRLGLRVPLDAIDAEHLVRDRLPAEDEAFESLLTSLKARGQQTPVEAVDLGQGRYGLISGWRRIAALRKLQEQTGEDRFAEALVFLRRPTEASDSYVAMVEENEIRVGLSFYERARIVLKSVDEGVFPDRKKALQSLFSAASAAKRSKVKSFFPLVEALDAELRFPTAIGERLGLALSKRLLSEEHFARRLAARLRRQAPGKPEAELALLNGALKDRALTDRGEGPAPEAPLASSVRTPGPGAQFPAASADRVVAPGIRMQTGGSAVRLSGSGIDETFVAALTSWLQSYRQGSKK